MCDFAVPIAQKFFVCVFAENVFLIASNSTASPNIVPVPCVSITPMVSMSIPSMARFITSHHPATLGASRYKFYRCHE